MSLYQPVQIHRNGEISFWASLTTPFSNVLRSTFITPMDASGPFGPLFIVLHELLDSTGDFRVDPEAIICRANVAPEFTVGTHRCSYRFAHEDTRPAIACINNLGQFVLLHYTHLSGGEKVPPVSKPPVSHDPVHEPVAITSACLFQDNRFEVCKQLGETIRDIGRMKSVPKTIMEKFRQTVGQMISCSKGNSIKIFPGATDPLNRILLYEQLFTEIRAAIEPFKSAETGHPLLLTLKQTKSTLNFLRQKAASMSKNQKNGAQKPVKQDKNKSEVIVNPTLFPLYAKSLPRQRGEGKDFVPLSNDPSTAADDSPVVMPVLLPYLTVHFTKKCIAPAAYHQPEASNSFVRHNQMLKLQESRKKLIAAVSKFGRK